MVFLDGNVSDYEIFFLEKPLKLSDIIHIPKKYPWKLLPNYHVGHEVISHLHSSVG